MEGVRQAQARERKVGRVATLAGGKEKARTAERARIEKKVRGSKVARAVEKTGGGRSC